MFKRLWLLNRDEIKDEKMLELKEITETPDHFENVQRQVDDVTEIMRRNTEAVLARGRSLNELYERAESLEMMSRTFTTKSVRVSKKFRRNHRKWLMIAGGALALVLVIVLAVISCIFFV